MAGIETIDSYFQFTEEMAGEPAVWYTVNAGKFKRSFLKFVRFLFDCPVQGATCNRLFKEFSRFLTKSRNRLGTDKLVKSTMIKYDMKKKYESDYDYTNKLQSSKNRAVNATEHKRVEPDDVAQQSQRRPSGPVQQRLTLLPTTAAAQDIPEVSDEEDGLDEDMLQMLPESVVMGIPEEYDVPELRAVLAAIKASEEEEGFGDLFEEFH